MKRLIAIIASVTVVVAMAFTGTIAYLTDTDSAVNVASLGNVDIEQHEKDADGNDFEDGQNLYPAYYAENEPLDTDGDHYFDNVTGSLEKTVTVKNVGKSEAYVRTWIAFEAGNLEYDDFVKYIIPNMNTAPDANGYAWNIVWDKTTTYEINNQKGEASNYYIALATLNKALPAGTTTPASLYEVVMAKEATNEVIAAMGDEYTILVYSQAMQTVNFEEYATNPAGALAIGFADETVIDGAIGFNHPWQDGFVQDYPFDKWQDVADTSWYNDTDTEFVITTPKQLAGFAKLVDEGKAFEGKTVKVGKNIDLAAKDENGAPVSFDPIGDKSAFKGTFDGQGYTISNLYQSGWDFGYQWGQYGSIGLFGEIEDATVKNLNIEGFEAQIEGGDIGGIVGSATGTCVFENITIEDTKLGTYNNGLGGIIGWSGAGNYTFKNISISEDTVLGGLWGSFDSSIGGIVGQGEPGATYNFENVEINCRLDAYNDCTASYDYYNYRMCGMIIGRLEATTTIDGKNYPDTSKYNITCNNVTVNYGDWMNYHYCEPTPDNMNGGRGMRVEPGFTYGGIPADYDHVMCQEANGQHMNLIPFDQIFGGAQLGVKGLKTYEGVTVNYPSTTP